MRQRMMLETRFMTQNDGQVMGFWKMYTLTARDIVTTDVSNELNFSLCDGQPPNNVFFFLSNFFSNLIKELILQKKKTGKTETSE